MKIKKWFASQPNLHLFVIALFFVCSLVYTVDNINTSNSQRLKEYIKRSKQSDEEMLKTMRQMRESAVSQRNDIIKTIESKCD